MFPRGVSAMSAGGAVLVTAGLLACTTTPPSTTGPTAPPASPAAPSPTSAAAACDGYPSRNIEVVIPSSPGGAFDFWGRLIAGGLEEHLPGDVAVVPMNRPGGGQMLGSTEVYNAPSDGYTLLFMEPGRIATAQTLGETDIDVKSFRGIAQVNVQPEVMVIGGQSEWDTVDEVLAASEQSPIRFGHDGLAAVQVLPLEILGIQWQGVLHEGRSEVVLAMARGDVDMMIFAVTSLADGILAAEHKPLLIIGEKPAEGEPGYEAVADTPTFSEQAGSELEALGDALAQHRMLMAPPETPDCVIEILETAALASMEDPDLLQRVEQSDEAVHPRSAGETQQIIDNALDALQPYAELLQGTLEE